MNSIFDYFLGRMRLLDLGVASGDTYTKAQLNGGVLNSIYYTKSISDSSFISISGSSNIIGNLIPLNTGLTLGSSLNSWEKIVSRSVELQTGSTIIFDEDLTDFTCVEITGGTLITSSDGIVVSVMLTNSLNYHNSVYNISGINNFNGVTSAGTFTGFYLSHSASTQNVNQYLYLIKLYSAHNEYSAYTFYSNVPEISISALTQLQYIGTEQSGYNDIYNTTLPYFKSIGSRGEDIYMIIQSLSNINSINSLTSLITTPSGW